MSNVPTISIIIIEYYSINEIEYCIKNLKSALESINYEIIISSNSCYSEEKKDIIITTFPTIKWIFNEKNGGFAYGMNRGLEVARGEYLAIINSDVLIKKGLKEMISFIEGHQEVGAIAPQIVDNKDIIQDSCHSYLTLWRYLKKHIKRILTNKAIIYEKKINYSKIQTVDWVIGAFIMVKREVYEKTNGLDEQYFLYVEDLDWCTRIRQVGYEIVYYPHSVVEYVGSRSARKSSKYARIFIKSLFIYWKKFGFFSGYPKRKSFFYSKD